MFDHDGTWITGGGILGAQKPPKEEKPDNLQRRLMEDQLAEQVIVQETEMKEMLFDLDDQINLVEGNDLK